MPITGEIVPGSRFLRAPNTVTLGLWRLPMQETFSPVNRNGRHGPSSLPLWQTADVDFWCCRANLGTHRAATVIRTQCGLEIDRSRTSCTPLVIRTLCGLDSDGDAHQHCCQMRKRHLVGGVFFGAAMRRSSTVHGLGERGAKLARPVGPNPAVCAESRCRSSLGEQATEHRSGLSPRQLPRPPAYA